MAAIADGVRAVGAAYEAGLARGKHLGFDAILELARSE